MENARDDVAAALDLTDLLPDQIVSRHPHQALLFLQRHRLLRIAKTAISPRLHLDEHQRLAVTRHDVDLAMLRAVTSRHDGISPLA